MGVAAAPAADAREQYPLLIMRARAKIAMEAAPGAGISTQPQPNLRYGLAFFRDFVVSITELICMANEASR